MKQKVIELNDVTCILGKTNVGLYENHLIDTAVIDTPLDLEAILITHGHADHFGSAGTLKRLYGGDRGGSERGCVSYRNSGGKRPGYVQLGASTGGDDDAILHRGGVHGGLLH